MGQGSIKRTHENIDNNLSTFRDQIGCCSSSNTGISDSDICYGALHNVAAKVQSKAQFSRMVSRINSTSTFLCFKLEQKGDCYFLLSESGNRFAILDIRTSKTLKTLSTMPALRFEAIVESRIASKRYRSENQISQSFPVSLNVFGPRYIANNVALHLAEIDTFLQHPRVLNPTIEYNNPQYLTFPDEDPDMRSLVGLGEIFSPSQQVRISAEIGEILESLSNVTGESSWQPPSGLITPLKKHQEGGLNFILHRENEESIQEISAQLATAILPRSGSSSQRCFGGLVADVMGLGKTLTMLTAILQARPMAETFMDFDKDEEGKDSKKMRTRATLVVVSSVQLIENWIAEAECHFARGTLSWISFHGQDRPREKEAFRSVDIVLTTYATLVADHTGNGTLQETEWFRVVLDEAHLIRNSSCKQFRSATNLHARSRWCLTGTPIQNRLDDLTSLAQFLRLPPLVSKGSFVQHVMKPLSGIGPDFANPLRSYLRAYCLRRTDACLDLPPITQEDVTLVFSEDEQILYERILEKTRGEIDSLISGGDTIRKYNTLFIAVLKMRILCNLGTFCSYAAQLSLYDQENSDAQCESCAAEDEKNDLVSNKFSVCPTCGRLLNACSPPPQPHMPNNRTTEGDPDINAIDDVNIKRAPSTSFETSDSPSLTEGGISTKLCAVVRNVAQSPPDAKSVIFSYWTSTLDSISQLLEQAAVPHVQIDGRVSYADRSKRLGIFKGDPKMPVLLMSIGTGAVGLNLTAANRVHIVEPQWNPSVEDQAIARAVRMGQTREVKVFRYLMEKTVEQNIRNLQVKKKELAKFTLDIETRENASKSIGDLRFILKT